MPVSTDMPALDLAHARGCHVVKITDANGVAAFYVHDGLSWKALVDGGGTVTTVADSAARLLLTPDEGDHVYQTDTGTFYVYDGSAWIAIPKAALVVQNAGSDVQADVDHLNFNVPGFAAAAGTAGVAAITRQAAIAITAQTTLAAWRRYTLAAGAGGGFKLLLPAAPAAGDEIEVVWKSGALNTNPILIRDNGDTTTLYTWNVVGTTGTLVYDGAAWKYHAKLWA